MIKMGRYQWIFPDKGTVTVYADNAYDAKVKINKILGRRPTKGRLVKWR